MGMGYKIKDDNGKYYEIKNLEKFAKHIFQFHSKGISLHQEKGFNFMVDEAFRDNLENFLKNKKK